MDCLIAYLIVGCLLALAAHSLDDQVSTWQMLFIVALWAPLILGIVIFGRFARGKRK